MESVITIPWYFENLEENKATQKKVKSIYIQAIGLHECEILIITSKNYFKETIKLDCDIRSDVELRWLHAHVTHDPLTQS